MKERPTKGWSSPALSNRLPLGDVQLLWNYGTVECFFQCGNEFSHRLKYSAAGYPFWIPLRLLQKATTKKFWPICPWLSLGHWDLPKTDSKQNIDFKMWNSAKWWVNQSENTVVVSQVMRGPRQHLHPGRTQGIANLPEMER